MMTYLTENLASKGFIVAAIDHTESTYPSVQDFSSTLYNRSLDQLFVLDAMAKLNESDDPLAGMIDADHTGLIGYSMGGYGALNSAGAGYSDQLHQHLPVLENRSEGNPAYEASLDDRLKAVIAFAPWGGDMTFIGAPNASMWTASALANIKMPSLWIAGDLDDISVYSGIVKNFEQSINSERYLLTYENALHNVAPNPPPNTDQYDVYAHLNEPLWDERRLNNINQHFITAFLMHYIKGEDHYQYLNPAVEYANDGVYSVDDDKNPIDDNTYWAGFRPRTAIGMRLRAEKP
jgi:predicted dienelactone hydrolase